MSQQKGGNTSLSEHLKYAIMPLYDNFKIIYDPIFSFIDKQFTPNGGSIDPNLIDLPSLLSLLAICNKEGNHIGGFLIVFISI